METNCEQPNCAGRRPGNRVPRPPNGVNKIGRATAVDLLADLPLDVDGYTLEGMEANVSSGFEWLTTIVHTSRAAGLTASGEDVVYDSGDQYGQSQSWWNHSVTIRASGSIATWSLGWNVFRDSSRLFYDGRPGVPRITAGESADWGTLGALAPAMKDRLAGVGFHLLGRGDTKPGNSYERIWRFIYPEDVIQGSSLDEQGRALGRWVIDAFEQVQTILAG